MTTIRLKKMGTKSRKIWRMVVSDSKVSREGRLIEEIGFYNPTVDPPQIRIQRDRYDDWIRKGAKPSRIVASLAEKSKKANAN